MMRCLKSGIWERKGFKDARKTAGTFRRLPGLSHSGNGSCVLGGASLHSCLEVFSKESQVVGPPPHHQHKLVEK